jgi:hypothetical protein
MTRALVWLVYVPLSVAMLLAFVEALELWLLWPPVASGALFALLWVLGPLGGVVSGVIGFFGAHQGWLLPWWQAALLAGAFVVVGFFAMAFSGVLGVFGRRTGSPRSGDEDRAAG